MSWLCCFIASVLLGIPKGEAQTTDCIDKVERIKPRGNFRKFDVADDVNRFVIQYEIKLSKVLTKECTLYMFLLRQEEGGAWRPVWYWEVPLELNADTTKHHQKLHKCPEKTRGIFKLALGDNHEYERANPKNAKEEIRIDWR